jgi:hypothetical protein
VLGTLIGLAPTAPSNGMPNGVVVYKNGYFITLEFSGKFPIGVFTGDLVLRILWTSTTCSGNGYLWDNNGHGGIVMGTKIVIYSGQTNSLYVPSGAGASATSTLAPGFQSLEFTGAVDGSSSCQPNSGLISSGSGWLLSPINASTALGWSVSGNPLGVAGPIKFQ